MTSDNQRPQPGQLLRVPAGRDRYPVKALRLGFLRLESASWNKHVPSNRGVSGFWLDIDALDGARTALIGELGAQRGLMAYGMHVRLFTWQYATAAPIRDAAHVAKLTGTDPRLARNLWAEIRRILPRSYTHRSDGSYCVRTMVVLDKYNKKQAVAGATSAPESGRDSYSDFDKRRKEKDSPNGESKKKVPPAAPATLAGLSVQAWEDYQQHRRDIRARALKPKSIERLQRWLVEQGDEAIQAAIVDQTIRNAWTGLFEIKSGNNGDGRREPRTKDEYEREQLERMDRGTPGEVLAGDGESVWPAVVRRTR